MEPVFALDIGTRMVMGLIMTKSEQEYQIVASAKTEHRQRAMYDGQVHDVDEVAQAVLRVKDELEAKTDTQLKTVAVAAAGRALITEMASAEQTEPMPIRWEREDILALEMEAVQYALRQVEFSAKDHSLTYHCVGYNVVSSWLEEEEIANLTGQRGRKAKVTVIATFLPRTVLDGLIAVLGRVGLEMKSLTLEPIAAGQAAIQANMRRLNLALVDIGAGTADIALTREGSFFAYGMVPMAGDEVTEAICAHYLLDFNMGEKVKRDLNKKEKLIFKDYFGKKITVAKQEVVEITKPVIKSLAEKISAEICKLNNGVTQAVILIGGGSLTCLLPDILTEELAIPSNRVGIQVRERLSGVYGEKSLKGPEAITPIGIGISALEEQGLHYYSVSVNDILVPIFELQLATVAEALLAAGIQPRSFLGRPGAALTFELNGEIQVVKGSLGKPAQYLVNGQPARLEQTLNSGDCVRFTPGIPGEEASVSISDILKLESAKKISWNGQEELFSPQIFINGKTASEKDKIPDGSKVNYYPNDNVADFLAQKGYKLSNEEEIMIKIDGQSRNIPVKREFQLNGKIIKENCPLNEGDQLALIENPLTVGDLQLKAQPMVFYVNGKEVAYPPHITKILWRGRELVMDEVIVDGMDLRVEGFNKKPVLSEILPYITIPQDVPSGLKLTLIVNGMQAEFSTVLHPGDRITVDWT
ncbi:MAG TPA: pilus assembly protein PilM [Desulfitobacteriaceae bacterium]|nr:pilus assembly protein PilM [Desulfitobacteriaceae bacterium]